MWDRSGQRLRAGDLEPWGPASVSARPLASPCLSFPSAQRQDSWRADSAHHHTHDFQRCVGHRLGARIHVAPPRLDVGADATRLPCHRVWPQRGVNSAAAAAGAEALQILPPPPPEEGPGWGERQGAGPGQAQRPGEAGGPEQPPGFGLRRSLRVECTSRPGPSPCLQRRLSLRPGPDPSGPGSVLIGFGLLGPGAESSHPATHCFRVEFLPHHVSDENHRNLGESNLESSPNEGPHRPAGPQLLGLPAPTPVGTPILAAGEGDPAGSALPQGK